MRYIETYSNQIININHEWHVWCWRRLNIAETQNERNLLSFPVCLRVLSSLDQSSYCVISFVLLIQLDSLPFLDRSNQIHFLCSSRKAGWEEIYTRPGLAGTLFTPDKLQWYTPWTKSQVSSHDGNLKLSQKPYLNSHGHSFPIMFSCKIKQFIKFCIIIKIAIYVNSHALLSTKSWNTPIRKWKRDLYFVLNTNQLTEYSDKFPLENILPSTAIYVSVQIFLDRKFRNDGESRTHLIPPAAYDSQSSTAVKIVATT